MPHSAHAYAPAALNSRLQLLGVTLRTVAFLDILGFREKILSLDLLELAEKYESVISQTAAINRPLPLQEDLPILFPGHPQQEQWCIRRIFSDSIILISKGDDVTSVLKLLIYAWRLTQVLIAYDMPVRGGVAYGEIYMNPTESVFLGRALTQAYDLERQQNWIGVAIDPTVEKAFPDLFYRLQNDDTGLSHVFFRYQVPLKGGSRKELHTLNWRFNLIVEKGTRSLFPSSNNDTVAEKIENTLEYAKTVVNTGQFYFSDETRVPVELRSFWVGPRKPPFPHGDDL